MSLQAHVRPSVQAELDLHTADRKYGYKKLDPMTLACVWSYDYLSMSVCMELRLPQYEICEIKKDKVWRYCGMDKSVVWSVPGMVMVEVK